MYEVKINGLIFIYDGDANPKLITVFREGDPDPLLLVDTQVITSQKEFEVETMYISTTI